MLSLRTAKFLRRHSSRWARKQSHLNCESPQNSNVLLFYSLLKFKLFHIRSPIRAIGQRTSDINYILWVDFDNISKIKSMNIRIQLRTGVYKWWPYCRCRFLCISSTCWLSISFYYLTPQAIIEKCIFIAPFPLASHLMSSSVRPRYRVLSKATWRRETWGVRSWSPKANNCPTRSCTDNRFAGHQLDEKSQLLKNELAPRSSSL